MRSYLILMIAIALLASYGCSDKKSAGRTPEETAKLARSGGGVTSGNAGLAQGPRTPADSSNQDQATSDPPADDQAGGDELSDDNSSDSEDGDAEAEEPARTPPPPPRRGRLPGQRRQVKTPSMSGGSPADREKMQRDREAKEKESKQNEDDQQANDNQRSRDNEPEETPEETLTSFYDRAVKAFASKYDTEAFQFLYAHYLADESAFSDYPLSWYDGISEPRVALRWGVAIDYNSGGYEGDPPVIGDPVDSGDSSSSRGGGSGSDFGAPTGNAGGSIGMQGGGRRRLGAAGRMGNSSATGGQGSRSRNNAPARPPREELDYYTGDFGEKLLRRYEMRRLHDEAYYGIVMREIEKESPTDEDARADEPPQQDNSRSSGGSGGGDDFGMVGGSGGSSARAPCNNQRGNRAPDPEDQGFEANESALAPGLMFLGVGNKKQMLENAKNLNLDVLLIFEVKVKHTERRNGDSSTKSNTRLVAYSVKTGEMLDTDCKSLSNLAVASAREKDREDPVELELDKLFSEMADKQLKAKDLPNIDSKIAQKRYEFLLGQDYDNPLPVLVEIKKYLQDGLLSQNEYLAACEQLLGDTKAQDLIDGDMMNKERALEDYLPGRYQVILNSGGDGEDFR